MKLDVSGGPESCWVWRGFVNSGGYGRIEVAGVKVLTHRIAWIDVHGVIPDGMKILHRCDNPPCCNPGHLFLGTQADNNKDRADKGRNGADKRRGEGNGGAVLTSDDVVEIRSVGKSVSRAALAAKFGVSISAIGCIRSGKTWSNLK